MVLRPTGDLGMGLTGAVSKTYDGTNTATLGAGNYTLTGTIYGTDLVALNNPTSGLYVDANVGTAKTVSVMGLALSNGNYVLAASTASAPIGTINAAIVTDAITPATLIGTVASTTAALATYAFAVTTNFTPISYTLNNPPFILPNNLVDSLYLDKSSVSGGGRNTR
jgi:hypothetical protein